MNTSPTLVEGKVTYHPYAKTAAITLMRDGQEWAVVRQNPISLHWEVGQMAGTSESPRFTANIVPLAWSKETAIATANAVAQRTA